MILHRVTYAVTIYNVDCLVALRAMPANSVHCVVTSPPYWGLRDYGVKGQIGLEPTLEAFLDRMTGVFREVRRVLKPSGTCWVNMGDAYAVRPMRKLKIKPKDLMMQPARLALAMHADGWWLRSEIIWAKSNPMPDSASDRPASTHEKIFLLSKSPRYFYDAEASREASSGKAAPGVAGWAGAGEHTAVSHAREGAGLSHAAMKRSGRFIKGDAKRDPATRTDGWKTDKVRGLTPRHAGHVNHTGIEDTPRGEGRNMRNVWTMATQPCPEAHFATFPFELPRRCIRAGCPEGGVVLDIFGGSGTTGIVADELGRDAILIELNPDYAAMAKKRIARERLVRKRASMADVADAALPPTPLEAWLVNAETSAR